MGCFMDEYRPARFCAAPTELDLRAEEGPRTSSVAEIVLPLRGWPRSGDGADVWALRGGRTESRSGPQSGQTMLATGFSPWEKSTEGFQSHRDGTDVSPFRGWIACLFFLMLLSCSAPSSKAIPIRMAVG